MSSEIGFGRRPFDTRYLREWMLVMGMVWIGCDLPRAGSRLGVEGATCTRTADCEPGLQCFGAVCQPEDEPPTQSGGDESDSHGSSSAHDDDDLSKDAEGADVTDEDCEEILCRPGGDDCPQDDQKCTPWRCGPGCCTNSTRCTEITGDRKPGEDCERDGERQIDNCGPTLFCMPDQGSSGQGGEGRCEQLCLPEVGENGNCEDLGLPGHHCFDFNQGSFPVCLEVCDPIDRDCEREGDECYLAIDNFFCTWPAGPTGVGIPGKPGEECYVEFGCQGGTICGPSSLDERCGATSCNSIDTCGCCMLLCDLRDDDPEAVCEVGETCVRAVPKGPEETRHVGVCVVQPK